MCQGHYMGLVTYSSPYLEMSKRWAQGRTVHSTEQSWNPHEALLAFKGGGSQHSFPASCGAEIPQLSFREAAARAPWILKV